MRCPKCSSVLAKGKDEKFQTLLDHVCDPNNYEGLPVRPTFKCVNPKCECSTVDIFWDEDGDLYGWSKDIFGNDESHSAFPSHSRKMDIEIYRKGLKKNIRLHPSLMLWFLQPMIDFKYEADEYGNVLKRTWKIVWLKKDHWQPWVKDEWGYTTHYSFPFVNIYRFLRHKCNMIKNIKENGKDNWSYKRLKESFELALKNDKRWWIHAELWLAKNVFFRKWYKLTLENNK